MVIAWSCRPRNAGEIVDEIPRMNAPVSRTLSSGGMLAIGERSNVALRVTTVRWSPPTLLDDVIVTFAGPAVAAVGSPVSITVSILNRSKKDLKSATLYVQKDNVHAVEHNLLSPRRKTISLGCIASESSTHVQLQCIPLHCGIMSLGSVHVRDTECEPDEDDAMWSASGSFEVFVVDPYDRIPGDPSLPGPIDSNMIP